MGLNTYPSNPFPPSTDRMDADVLEAEVNKLESDVDQLKSGLTNVDVALSVPEGSGKNHIYMTLDSIKALNIYGTWSGNAYTLGGVTFTVDTDGNGRVIGIITDGTASGGNIDFVFSDSIIIEPNTDYIVTGCPNGGGASTYRIRVYESTWGQVVYDAGSGFSFNSGTYTWTGARITVYNGVNVTGKTFYPMLRLANVSDSTFVPYIPSVESRIEAVESGLTDFANLKFLPVNFTDTFEAGATSTNGVTVSDLTGGVLTNDSRIKGIVLYNVYPFYMFQLQYQGKIMLGTDVARTSQETITNRMVIMYI